MAASLIGASKWLAGRSYSDLNAPSAAWSFAFAMLLLPHDDFAALGSGYRAPDEQQVLFHIDPNHIEVLDAVNLVPMMASHALARESAAGIGMRADGTGLTDVLGSVGLGTALEFVALDGARETAALALAHDGDFLVAFEDGDVDFLAYLEILEVFETPFGQPLAGGEIGLFKHARLGLVQALDVGGTGGDLDGRIPVLFLRLELHHGGRRQLDDGHGDAVAVLSEYLGHSQFGSYRSEEHT